jgi:hypothetical protein
VCAKRRHLIEPFSRTSGRPFKRLRESLPADSGKSRVVSQPKREVVIAQRGQLSALEAAAQVDQAMPSSGWLKRRPVELWGSVQKA